MALLLLACLLTLFLLSSESRSSADTSKQLPEGPHPLETDIGTFRGKVKKGGFDSHGATYVTYPGIPFAKPPIDELRFKRPQDVDPQTFVPGVVVNIANYKKSCWSSTKTYPHKYYGEDCLYLNIYVPGQLKPSREPYPVMIWLHGGGFVAGNTFPEPGKMVTEGNVIVVSVNYRLGMLGFLTTNDDDLPANNGLWDQYMAIKWVKRNIKHFNGDENSITIFGLSAGSTSVSLHALSPVSSHLFHKAVMQSGGAATTVVRDYRERAYQFASLVGCSSMRQSSSGLSDCLKNIGVSDILKHSKPESYDLPRGRMQVDYIWGPVIDGTFIPDEPMNLLKNHSYLHEQGVFNKNYLLGIVTDEGTVVTQNFYYPISVDKLANTTFFGEMRQALLENKYGLSKKNTPRSLVEAINYIYMGERTLTKAPNPKNVLDFCGDAMIVSSTLETALAFSSLKVEARAAETPKVFFYLFDFCPAKDADLAPCFAHGDEFHLEFPKRNITDPVTRELSDMFIRTLTNFARASDPSSAVKYRWPQFDPSHQKYFRIDRYPDVQSMLHSYRMNFWRKVVPKYLSP